MSNRIEFVDSFRGIAALLVVMYHYIYRYEYSYSEGDVVDLYFLSYGVHLFFIISGFVIFFSIHNEKSAFNFLRKRFFRLYPTYWACVFVTYFFY